MMTCSTSLAGTRRRMITRINVRARRQSAASSICLVIAQYECRKPKSKKIPETNDIFEEIKRIRNEAEQSENQLLTSYDAKATVKIGEFSRDGEKSKLSRLPRLRFIDIPYKAPG